jgi:hypothetical protein
MREAFWKFAHWRYQRRIPRALTELTLFSWGLLFLVVYAGALARGWTPDGIVGAIVGLLSTVAPLLIGALHWRIRTEAAKGYDALYRKLVSVMREQRP